MIKAKKVLRYYTPCGRGFWKKQSAIKHEENCKCWTNPKFKTCKTCRHNLVSYDEDDYSIGYKGEGYTNECRIGVEYEGPEWTAAHEKAPDININCPKWEAW